MTSSQNIRNVAIIAHVDHGKTKLVEKMLSFCGEKQQRENKTGELDNNELEKERGITILSKNVSIQFKGTKINIIDTPGHADFGGEVERVLNMADGVLLLVDAFEGPMPQTRYVLSKALSLKKKIIAVINKVDKPNCRPKEVHEMIFDLMVNLEADDEQLDFPVVFGSAKLGWMGENFANPTQDLSFLMETIIKEIPPPSVSEGSLQFQITSIDFSNYLGRIAVGRIYRGSIKKNQLVAVIDRKGEERRIKIKDIYVFKEFEKEKMDEVSAGEICAISGLDSFEIGETVTDPEFPETLPPIPVDEPTMSMTFTINNSPFYGQEGKLVTSRQIRERLYRETEKNLALRVTDTNTPDSFNVYGRGILHLSILIETMRREGFELQLGQPKVLLKKINDKTCEPIESLFVDSPEAVSGKIISAVSNKKGTLLKMEEKGDMIHMEFEIPSRGLLGLRGQILTLSSGQATMNHSFKDYVEFKGELPTRQNGVMVALEKGQATAYSIFLLQDRGRFFISPGQMVYEGMIVGENSKENDLVVNVAKGKKLTNVRASGSDEKLKLEPPVKMTLESCLEYIQEDEYVEVTPQSIRLRKIFLKEHERKRKQPVCS